MIRHWPEGDLGGPAGSAAVAAFFAQKNPPPPPPPPGLSSHLPTQRTQTVFAKVFAGALGALAVMTVLSAMLGWAAPNLIPKVYTHYAATALFFFFGFKTLYDVLIAADDVRFVLFCLFVCCCCCCLLSSGPLEQTTNTTHTN